MRYNELKRSGVSHGFRYMNGDRPRNPRTEERDENVARLRVMLQTRVMTVEDVMAEFGVVKGTARNYLARAKRPA